MALWKWMVRSLPKKQNMIRTRPIRQVKHLSDHFVRAYHDTYGLPVVVSNCSNNYGANHFPEKLIPLSINNIKHNKPIPIYGKGENIRDWLWGK